MKTLSSFLGSSFIYTSENLLLSVFVVLSVIPVKVEVEEGATSVTLPFKTTKNLSGEIQVIWERYEPFQKAHVFTNGQNQYEEQHEVYRGRTVMNEDLLKTGDLSLTLEYPTDADSGEYKCLVWRKGTFIRKKTVLLKVKGWFFPVVGVQMLCSPLHLLYVQVHSGEDVIRPRANRMENTIFMSVLSCKLDST
uniref:Immunoglobulin V-set domain-containing protein n=1 Tax=Pundamilia nyererei TaxID=303518 RepID=A0A3B4FBX6_9CICH